MVLGWEQFNKLEIKLLRKVMKNRDQLKRLIIPEEYSSNPFLPYSP
jgi:hypothetical protein